MDVAIAGSSGFLGTALRTALEERGDRVLRLVRPSSPRGGDAVEWDPDLGRIDAAALEGVHAVVNLAGVGIGDARGTPKRLHAIRRSRVVTTDLLARTVASLQHPPLVFLGQSAIGYYGDRGDDLLDEDELPGPDYLAGVVADWEAACEPARAAGLRVVNTRTGLVLWPSGGLLKRLLLPFRLGFGARLGSGRQWQSWVSLPDLMRAMLHVLDNEVVAGPVNVVAPAPVRNDELTRALARVLHRPAKLSVPQIVLDLAAGKPLGRATTSSQRVTCARLQGYGFVFTHDHLEDALHAGLSSR